MAASAILDKYSAQTAITITLASLASSTARVGRGSASVDNTTTRYLDILLYLKIKLGAASTVDRSVQVYLLRDSADGTTPLRTDGWGGTDLGLTVLNAQLVGILVSKTAAETLQGEFLINRPGPKWGIAIVHDTVIALDATEANHVKAFIGLNPEAQ